MLSEAGELKILDLGLARFRGEPLTEGDISDAGTTLGTAEYIAPEQAMDSHHVDIRADIYSLGCTLFRLLTGQPPYSGPKYRSAAEKMAAHMHEPLPEIRKIRSEVPEALAEILGRMMAKNPDDRFATPAEVAAAIMPFAAGNDLAALVKRFDVANEQAGLPECSSNAYVIPPEATDASGNQASTDHANASSPAKTPLPQANLRKPSFTRFAATFTRIAIGVLARGMVALTIAVSFGWRFWPQKAADRHEATTPPPSHQLPEADLHGSVLPQGQWVDVLPHTDVDRDRLSNYWEIREDGIGCSGANGYPRFALPVAVHGDYDLEVKCTRNSGNGLIRISFPVGDANTVQLLLGSGVGTLYGFSEFNGHGLTDPQNSSARLADRLMSGKPYKVLISVRLQGNQAAIEALLDGRSLVKCLTAPSAFPAYHFAGPFEQVRPQVGVEAGSDATFHAVRVRLAGGQGAIKPPRRTEPCPAGQWVDLLPRIDIVRDRLTGTLTRERGGFRLSENAGQAVMMFPAAMQGSYELQMEFTHSPTSGMVSLVVPVGPRRVRVNTNIKGELHPEGATINQPAKTSTDGSQHVPADEIAEGAWHSLCLKVETAGVSAAIDVLVDGERRISWSGLVTELYDGPGDVAESDRIGLIASGVLTLRTARLQMTSGKGLLVAGEAAKQRP